ncbi:hypothetical protein ARMGADRAFT_299518 [Armillaria gallica]|uniref:Uncharacterized protein n=1 Tax=Armillaria gallica TaxID=47427 RepID=A0A2H3DI31_ARMGA|nr:hypothetical protein ARMGADRAFT_299518 [Armillaria gallica]
MNIRVKYIRGKEVEKILRVHTNSTVQAPKDRSRQVKRERSVSTLNIRRRRTYFAMIYQMSKNKTKAASGLVICNYDGRKVINTNLSPSNVTSPRDMEDWEVPVSEIRSWTYTLGSMITYMKGSPLIATSQIEVFGFENVRMLRERTLESTLDERGVLLLACEGEVLVSLLNSVIEFKNSLVAEKSRDHQRSGYGLEEQNYCYTEQCAAYPPIRFAPPCVFIPERRAIYPRRSPDDVPTLEVHEYDRWFLLTLLGKPCNDNRKASEERKILWRLVHHDPCTKPDDWADFLCSKRDNRTQHHRASCNELANTIYDNMASIGPSGLTTTMPSQSSPLLRPHHQLQTYQPVSPTSQPPTLVLPAGYPRRSIRN